MSKCPVKMSDCCFEQQRLKISVVFPDVEPYVTKFGMVLHQHKPECHAKTMGL